MDVATGFSATRLSDSRFMSESMKSSELAWINHYGAPINLSADPEFLNKFTSVLNYFKVNFHPTSSRRHNEIGVLKEKLVRSDVGSEVVERG